MILMLGLGFLQGPGILPGFSILPGAGGTSLAFGAPSSTLPPTMPVDEIRAGMKARARTVFRGTEIEGFDLTIIDVLRNVTPGGDLILARAEGDSLEQFGIVQGMSGSPVYIGDRVIGAIAYGWEFSREPITGITPIGEMLDLFDDETLPARPAEDGTPAAPLGAPLERTGARNAGTGSRGDEQMGATEPRPLRTPVSIAGLDPRAVDLLRDAFADQGWSLVPVGAPAAAGGVSADGATVPDSVNLEPGSALGVLLANGDASLAGIGTVTWRDGDRILAFGHPLFQSGDVDLPLTAAYVHATVPLATRSFKLATALHPIGLITGDRRTGIVGRLGLAPDLIPFDVKVSGSERARPRHFHYGIIRNREFTPILVGVLAMNSLLAEGAMNQETFLAIRMEAELAGGRRVVLHDRLSSMLPPLSVMGEVAAPIQILMDNPFRNPGLRSISVDVEEGPAGRYAVIENARLLNDRVDPGDTVAVDVDLRPYRGRSLTRRVRVPLPRSFREGELTLRVSDADTAAAWDLQRAPATFVPRDFDHLIELIESTRTHDALYVQVVSPGGGRVIDGREYPGLPETIRSVMRTGAENGSTLRATRVEILSETRVPQEFQVIGHRELTVRVGENGEPARRRKQ